MDNGILIQVRIVGDYDRDAFGAEMLLADDVPYIHFDRPGLSGISCGHSGHCIVRGRDLSPVDGDFVNTLKCHSGTHGIRELHDITIGVVIHQMAVVRDCSDQGETETLIDIVVSRLSPAFRICSVIIIIHLLIDRRDDALGLNGVVLDHDGDVGGVGVVPACL